MVQKSLGSTPSRTTKTPQQPEGFFILSSMLKTELYKHCEVLLETQIETLRNWMQEKVTDAENDTKSSAGDKHETGRSMLQLEQEKINRQLDETQLRLKNLRSIKPDTQPVEVQTGALFCCSGQWFYIAVALGKVSFEETEIMVISPDSPLAQVLKGAQKGENRSFNQRKYTIDSLQ